jgi:uncharacterized protein involved in response to NO
MTPRDLFAVAEPANLPIQSMGTGVPAMLIRLSQGHTGRPIPFTLSVRVAISIMWLGAFFRIVAPQLWPVSYQNIYFYRSYLLVFVLLDRGLSDSAIPDSS